MCGTHSSDDVGELDEIGCPLCDDIHWDLGVRRREERHDRSINDAQACHAFHPQIWVHDAVARIPSRHRGGARSMERDGARL